MNIDTSISIARILDRLNSMYNNIGSRSVYLSSDGSAIDEIGGDRRSSSPLAVEERCRWWCDEPAGDGDDVPTLLEDEPSWRLGVKGDAGIEKLRWQHNNDKRKALIDYLKIFQTKNSQ